MKVFYSLFAATLTAASAAARPIVSVGEDVQIIPNVISPEEIHEELEMDWDSPQVEEYRDRVKTIVPPKLVRRLRNLVPGVTPFFDDSVSAIVQGTIVDQDTPVHIDHYETAFEICKARIGFVMLSNQTDGTAHFVVNDISIPFETGTFVHWNPVLVHSTRVEAGTTASILGPIELEQFVNVYAEQTREGCMALCKAIPSGKARGECNMACGKLIPTCVDGCKEDWPVPGRDEEDKEAYQNCKNTCIETVTGLELGPN